jgi:hypothetical protein
MYMNVYECIDTLSDVLTFALVVYAFSILLCSDLLCGNKVKNS